MCSGRCILCHEEIGLPAGGETDRRAQRRRSTGQSSIILWPYPIDPWPGEPLSDAYDLLIYPNTGHRPQLLEHLAETFPRHIQIHYGRYRREESFDASRRSRACAYLADDAHGPLALRKILLAGCPTVGVRTGASFVRTGETGVVVYRLPPERQCAESDEDVRALAVFIESIEQAQAIDRHSVRDRAAAEFDTCYIVASVLTMLMRKSEAAARDFLLKQHS
jgi:hypothetical protein